MPDARMFVDVVGRNYSTRGRLIDKKTGHVIVRLYQIRLFDCHFRVAFVSQLPRTQVHPLHNPRPTLSSCFHKFVQSCPHRQSAARSAVLPPQPLVDPPAIPKPPPAVPHLQVRMNSYSPKPLKHPTVGHSKLLQEMPESKPYLLNRNPRSSFVLLQPRNLLQGQQMRLVPMKRKEAQHQEPVL